MTIRMLIDARHQEETRVAVVKGNRIEEFDFEAESRKQIKGNIYLAKVTRVEPSLQAAFIDYGGNRHGFLAFSEIHPDYYQIPKEDRDALLREEQRLVEEHGAHDDSSDDAGANAHDDDIDDRDDDRRDRDRDGSIGENGEPSVRPEEHGNSEEAGAEALRRRRMALRRRYKIQEVIRRRQVMLVQVVKEERGNKGAALTTYISLAGRYSVLMPNTAQGGGISRKIANVADRKRLKTIMTDLALPATMGAIVRTAGLERTRAEIKRDFDYLTRLWDDIRDKTLTSSAPALIYEDSDLVKRAIRDIYSRDIDEVLVDGAEGYAQARTLMKLLMPSHARKVQLYNNPVPLFHRAGVESQLAALLNPVVNLRSGGYIVINPTEALVAIDVNSGRSTREYNIEETALKTNIEAAEEVARQLRLRDLAGLVVVDFIDMESNSNNRKVERSLKDALRHDRARIQVGRISSFGLLEMSRQRLRTGVLEASTEVCPMCDGSGLVRTDGSSALAALRLLEEEAVRGRASMFRLRADRSVAVYMLNRKRAQLAELEGRYGVRIEVVPDDSLIGGRIAIDSSGPPPAEMPRMTALAAPATDIDDLDHDIDDEDEAEHEAEYEAGGDDDDDVTERRNGERTESPIDERTEERGRGRRRRRRSGRDRGPERRDRPREEGGREDGRRDDLPSDDGRELPEVPDDEAMEPADIGQTGGDDRESRRKRRRRRRPARRDGVDQVAAEADEQAEDGANDSDPEQAPAAPERERPAPKARRSRQPKADAQEARAEPAAEAAAPEAESAEEPAPVVRKRSPRAAPAAAAPRRAKAAAGPVAVAAVAAEPGAGRESETPVAKPRRTRKAKEAAPAEAVSAGESEPEDAESTADGLPRRGWWQRTFGN